MPTVSIIIPCFNNEAQLQATCEAIALAVAPLRKDGLEFELLLVDDCSTDSTWNVITALRDDFPFRVVGLRLRWNVGAYHAIVPAMERASGNAIIVMAADGDDPPQLIPELVGHWNNGHKLVQAERDRPSASWINRMFGRVFYFKLRLFGVKHLPEHGCDFMLADRTLVQAALRVGFRSGNTLIQLYQHAESAYRVPYRKGANPDSGWTLGKKARLFVSTLFTAIGLSKGKVVTNVVQII